MKKVHCVNSKTGIAYCGRRIGRMRGSTTFFDHTLFPRRKCKSCLKVLWREAVFNCDRALEELKSEQQHLKRVVVSLAHELSLQKLAAK